MSSEHGGRDEVWASGLEGTQVARTALSDVDGERGRLIVAGYDVEDLATRFSFEDVCALLWDGRLPAGVELERELGRARIHAFARLPGLGDALGAPDAMDAVRASIAHLRSEGDEHAERISATAAMAVYAAAWARLRAGREPIAPDPERGHAADFLKMATGGSQDAASLEAYLVTVAEHGMNASTFAARVVASTGSDLVSSVVAALGALKGPLHGGAPGLVLEMLDAIGAPERAESWLAGELEAGRRVMGMGHRIYRVRDPRAAVLESRVGALGDRGRLALARGVEKAAERLLAARHPDRPLRANVEFYTAVLLEAVGLPRELFTATFAVGRVIGWCAHVAEQRAVGKLIRPASRYVGKAPPAVTPAAPASRSVATLP